MDDSANYYLTGIQKADISEIDLPALAQHSKLDWIRLHLTAKL